VLASRSGDHANTLKDNLHVIDVMDQRWCVSVTCCLQACACTSQGYPVSHWARYTLTLTTLDDVGLATSIDHSLVGTLATLARPTGAGASEVPGNAGTLLTPLDCGQATVGVGNCLLCQLASSISCVVQSCGQKGHKQVAAHNVCAKPQGRTVQEK
jgi:hypothetical protein